MAKRRTNKPVESLADDRILEPKELLERIPLDRSTLYRMVQEGRFPAPIQLTTSRIGWRWSAIVRWLGEREAGHLEGRTRYGRDKDKPADDAA
jgi:prophage regulatory protein